MYFDEFTKVAMSYFHFSVSTLSRNLYYPFTNHFHCHLIAFRHYLGVAILIQDGIQPIMCIVI